MLRAVYAFKNDVGNIDAVSILPRNAVFLVRFMSWGANKRILQITKNNSRFKSCILFKPVMSIIGVF